MDDIKEKIILENPEEPILTLNFKCNSNDYRYSEEIWPKQYGKAVIYNLTKRTLAIIISCIFLILLYSKYGLNYSKFNVSIAFIITIAAIKVIKNIYFIICCMRKYTYSMHIVTGRRIRSLALVYQNRTIEEIKKIIIPCQYRFYDTYFIKTIPLPETMYKTAAEKIVDLPLILDTPVDYSLIEHIYENRKCITFLSRIFFPKNQLSKYEKQQLDLILDKICSQNDIIR